MEDSLKAVLAAISNVVCSILAYYICRWLDGRNR